MKYIFLIFVYFLSTQVFASNISVGDDVYFKYKGQVYWASAEAKSGDKVKIEVKGRCIRAYNKELVCMPSEHDKETMWSEANKLTKDSSVVLP